jgi:hypothetical protein
LGAGCDVARPVRRQEPPRGAQCLKPRIRVGRECGPPYTSDAPGLSVP